MLDDLPEMYQHCKATEDKDMTPVDFITDHLMNIDCILDQHTDGDDQKPHKPIQSHLQQQVQCYILPQAFNVPENRISVIQAERSLFSENDYFSTYSSLVFRPPIG